MIKCPKCKHKFKIKISPTGLNFFVIWIGASIFLNILNWNDKRFIVGYNLGVISFFVNFLVIKLMNKYLRTKL